MDRAPRVVQYGLGPIGVECVRTLLERGEPGTLVGAVDIDPQKVGLDVGRLLGRTDPVGVTVTDDAGAVLRETDPDVVLHTSSSFLDRAAGQLEACIRAGAHVVSSCEELLYPYDRHPEISRRLDALAREHGVGVLGTGVNPGYVMDSLALMATGVCRSVRHVRAVRVVDAALRRLPLLRKVGAGLTPEQFQAKKAAGGFGHIGLVESLRLVAAGLGLTLDRVDEQLHPVPAASEIVTPEVTVAAGAVAGIHHTAAGFVDGDERVKLDLEMYAGAPDPHDAVVVLGDPPVDLLIRGGVFGDTATVAVLLNAIPRVAEAAPGLLTMADIPLLRARAGS
ncbi:MAG: dihydrodipicolinate reductase [bacterium]|nr:dihydrodipicolinate reductase [bacterium]